MSSRRRVPPLAVREGGANVAASPLRSLLVALVAALLAATVVAASAAEVAGIASRYREQVEQGRFVLVVRSPSRNGLDAARCDAVRDLPGVRSAGAVLGQRSVYPVAAPLRPYDQLVVTPGLVPVWFPEAAPSTEDGVLVGPGAAEELGLIEGATIETGTEPARRPADLRASAVRRSTVAAVLPGSQRNPEADRMVFDVAAPTGRASVCFVDPDPSARRAVEASLVGWFGLDDAASVSPLLDDGIVGRTPEIELATRPTQWIWGAASVALVALLVVTWHARRSEFALYRLLGLRSGAIALLLATEGALTVGLPALIGGSLATVGSMDALEVAARNDGGVPTLAPLVVADATSFVLVLVLAPLVGWLVLARRSTVDVLKGF